MTRVGLNCSIILVGFKGKKRLSIKKSSKKWKVLDVVRVGIKYKEKLKTCAISGRRGGISTRRMHRVECNLPILSVIPP